MQPTGIQWLDEQIASRYNEQKAIRVYSQVKNA